MGVYVWRLGISIMKLIGNMTLEIKSQLYDIPCRIMRRFCRLLCIGHASESRWRLADGYDATHIRK